MRLSPQAFARAASVPLILALALLGLLACSDATEPTEPSRNAAPDFALRDVNPGSASFDETISPRDYLGQVSAWYFAHST